ncbi:MAG TPA: phosphate ABC transporter substrate-binding protein PstS [Longimicrobiales bacterium]|nr:phosphate ABC transporter substrate-binding protein PstS [Longimicrobiales bacterium]
MRRAIWAVTATVLVACGGGDQSSPRGGADQASARGGGADLTGAGATFPYPVYSKWFYDYAQRTGVKINYQSIGSGGGIRQLTEGTVDFGASDAPMSDEEMATAGGDVLHFPTVIGAVAVTYNLPDVQETLRITPDILADIFLGEITKWDDPRLADLNSGITLPSEDLLVVHRSDGSGTTFIFTDYLSSVSEAWRTGPGKGKEVRWPVGLGGKGNEGVAGQVKQTPGSIGYVELAYANQNDLAAAELRNRAGNFVAPSLAGATAAAAGIAESLPQDTDFRVSIVNAPGEEAYPISSFTWLLVHREMQDADVARKLVDFIRWALTAGEDEVAALDYAPLPPNMVELEMEQLEAIEYPGKM